MRKNLDLSHTIFARCSGTLPSAVAILRVSGSLAFPIFKKIFSPVDGKKVERVRGMALGRIVGVDGVFIDEVLVLSFETPKSFTGEDVIEIQCHGSEVIVTQIEAQLVLCGARPAERGEFSYRAFLNQKMAIEDLENLADVFASQQPVDLHAIYQRKDGAFHQRLSLLRSLVIQIQAVLDTAVDFSEEYSEVLTQVKAPLSRVIHECSLATHRYESFRYVENIPRIVLAGLPNAGKSSLFNLLLSRYRAIVHSEPGTTRDVIEELIEVDGRKCRIVDTAGIRTALNEIEVQGIELGGSYIKSAQLILYVIDGSVGVSEEDRINLADLTDCPKLIVWNKRDSAEFKADGSFAFQTVEVSASTGDGFNDLWLSIRDQFKKSMSTQSTPLPTHQEYGGLMRAEAIARELESSLWLDCPPEILSELNRRLMTELECMVGGVFVEDVLDRVFNEFCIGK